MAQETDHRDFTKLVSASGPWNAMGGGEIKQSIVAQIQRKMDADTRLASHLVYQRISWRFSCEIEFYPYRSFEMRAAGELEGPPPPPPPPPPTIEFAVPSEEEVPDKPLEVSDDPKIGDRPSALSIEYIRVQAPEAPPTWRAVWRSFLRKIVDCFGALRVKIRRAYVLLLRRQREPGDRHDQQQDGR